MSALRGRDRVGINDAAARLLAQRAALGNQWIAIARALAHNGEVSLAIQAGERAAEESGPSSTINFELATLLASSGHQLAAAKLVEAIDSEDLSPAQREHFLGTCALETGDFTSARRWFDEAVSIEPRSGASWLSLAALPAHDDADLLGRLEMARCHVASAGREHQAQWHYARGSVLARLCEFHDAFHSFSAGAEIVRTERRYDPLADLRAAEKSRTGFDGRMLTDGSRDKVVETGRPILITGLPRSGTTLAEHIVAAHGKVSDGGEVAFGAIVAREVGGVTAVALKAYLAREHTLEDLARLYLHLADERFEPGRRFVDKSLGNTRLIGLLASILPEAPIIWLRRDPVDCAWSCFRTYFSRGLPWSWSLANIAAHFHAEDALYAHWRRKLGSRLLTVPYEELTESPDSWSNRMVAHAGLPIDQQIYSAHLSSRTVITSSAAQVREPINRKGVGAATPYRPYLGSFIDAYRPTE